MIDLSILIGLATWNIETTKVILQAATLLAVILGLSLTIYQLHLFRMSYADLHDWNRRKAAQEAIDDMVPRITNDTPLLNRKFEILTKNDPIKLELIEKECSKDDDLRLAIHKRLNYFESLAAGVQQGVFDEEVIKNSYRHLFANTFSQFSEYINHTRSNGFREMWSDLEDMTERWKKEDEAKSPRATTGSGHTSIRARKTRGG